MNKKIQKTNAMRMLESAKIPYEVFTYPHEGEALHGTQVASLLGIEKELVYKTLVTTNGGEYFVFVIPITAELNLKKAAKAVSAKNLSMVKVADLLSVTGYVRGGCTPVGMKKQFVTVFDVAMQQLDEVYISGGKIGLQMRVPVQALAQITSAIFAEVANAPV